MTREEAHAVLSAIADGYDPRTGEELPPSGLWSDARVLRALFTALVALQEPLTVPPARPPRRQPDNAGAPWSVAEDEALRTEFVTEKSVTRLAKLHSRSTGAITARLGRLGLLATPPANVTEPVKPSRTEPLLPAEPDTSPSSEDPAPSIPISPSDDTQPTARATGTAFVFRVRRAELFPPEERTLLQEYGVLLQGLAEGSVVPENPVQEQFVAACQAGGPAQNEFERVWLKYSARLRWEADSLNENITDEPIAMPDPDRAYYTSKVAKGAKFFQRRKHS